MAAGRVQVTFRIGQLAAVFFAISPVTPLRFVLAEPLRILAAFTDLVKPYPAVSAEVSTAVFGPSGVLRDRGRTRRSR
jgi:hypothetical protein